MNLTLDLGLKCANFFHWWTQTLASVVPHKLQTFFSDSTNKPLFIRFTNFQVYFYSIQNNGTETELAHFYLHQEGRKQCEDFFNANPQWQLAEKILLLNEKQALKKILSLPLAAQGSLARVVSYEMDRFTPFKIDHLYFTLQVIRKDNENKKIEVDFTFISKDRLNNYYKELKEWGLVADAVFCDGKRTYVESDNLLPEELRPERSNIRKIISRALMMSFFVLSLGSLAIPLWLQNEAIDHLKHEITDKKRKAKDVDVIKSEVDSKIQVVNQVAMLKQSSPPVLNILSQLTELLPKKTYLKSFEYTGNKIQILGLSPSASTLIGILETSPYFKQTNFVSPITQDTEAGVDQFQLSAQIEEVKNVQ